MTPGRRAIWLFGLNALLLAGCQTVTPPRDHGVAPATAPPMNAPAAPPAPTPADAAPVEVTSALDQGPVGTATAATSSGVAPSTDQDAGVDVERSGAEVFAHLRSRLDATACGETSERNPWYHHYLHHADALSRQLAAALPLLDFVDREVEAQSLPAEFALMPLVESGYRPNAMGAGGPAGLWQMIGSTARNHGVQMTPAYDGRLSPLDSTRAALSYLGTLQPMFDRWQAIAMAYNAGENRMRRAMASDGPTVSSLNRRPRGLSAVTYGYVAKLEALACLLANPPAAFDFPAGIHFEPLLPARIPDVIDSIDELSAATGVATADLRRLNPGYRRKRIDAGAARWLLLPATATARLAGQDPLALAMSTPASATPDPTADANANADAGAAASGASTKHEVQAGDTLWSIAKRYGLSLDTLLKINSLRRQSPLHPGQTLRLLP